MPHADPEARKAYMQQYYQDHKETYKSRSRARHAKNREEKKAYYWNNREECRERQNKWFREHPVNTLLIRARRRAKVQGIEFDLTKEDIIVPEVCPVLGLRFTFNGGKPEDTSPSLDKIDPDKGYVRGNVKVISWRANKIKHCGTAEEHEKIAAYMRSELKSQ